MRANVALFAILSVTVATGFAGGPPLIPGSSSVGAIPASPGAGLNAEVWHYGVTTTADAVAWALGNSSDGTFLSTLVDYPNGPDDVTSGDTSLPDILGVDAPSYQGSESGVFGEIFRFSGYIAVPETRSLQTFSVGSDDGMRLTIGGVTVVEYPTDRGFGFSTMTVSFEQAGLYPIELWFYSNIVGQSGVEFYSSIPGGPDYGTPFAGGTIVPTALLYPVPEPASLALLALAGVVGIRRR